MSYFSCFFVIRHPGYLGCGWFSPLALGCGGSVKGYTYVVLVFACCKSVLVSKVTPPKAKMGWPDTFLKK
jgi:hypothetical protein